LQTFIIGNEPLALANYVLRLGEQLFAGQLAGLLNDSGQLQL
jgi:hypothetical protein